MEHVVASGAVDAVGLARPMALEPDLPARILSGASASAREVDLRVGIRLLDDMLQAFFCQVQFARMARGLDPDPGLSRWRIVFAGILNAYAYNPLRLLLPRRRLEAPRTLALEGARVGGELEK
jgi:hypothetical protein